MVSPARSTNNYNLVWPYIPFDQLWRSHREWWIYVSNDCLRTFEAGSTNLTPFLGSCSFMPTRFLMRIPCHGFTGNDTVILRCFSISLFSFVVLVPTFRAITYKHDQTCFYGRILMIVLTISSFFASSHFSWDYRAAVSLPKNTFDITMWNSNCTLKEGLYNCIIAIVHEYFIAQSAQFLVVAYGPIPRALFLGRC